MLLNKLISKYFSACSLSTYAFPRFIQHCLINNLKINFLRNMLFSLLRIISISLHGLVRKIMIRFRFFLIKPVFSLVLNCILSKLSVYLWVQIAPTQSPVIPLSQIFFCFGTKEILCRSFLTNIRQI